MQNSKPSSTQASDNSDKKRKREGNEKSSKKIQLNIDNSFVSKEISTFICNEIVNKFKIFKSFEPTDKTPFFIIYSNARELMKKVPSLVESIYNMEISKEFKLSNLIPIGFDAEYRKDWKISNIQISLQEFVLFFKLKI
ncbi:predicted protein [Naegleria gruberi]|uniref:Predicted protein n=1 Tax=Naegleria gruberi TaxID=5762 RepID=D2V3E8_NAEGR|nr:uncharacterized protein NAEGRDRAFT_63332 [Naegleria gruberi]EFC48759.1 predicted protein [Naegleria gruberi]|eukprot:XP_002681503.1 predicted protein [Naegleria gruberi strain NEG-M]